MSGAARTAIALLLTGALTLGAALAESQVLAQATVPPQGKSAGSKPSPSTSRAPKAPPAKARSTPPAKAGASTGAPAQPAPPATRSSQQTLQREQRALQAELARLKRQLAASESSRSEASDALAGSERAISDVNRRLRELAQSRARLEQQLAALAEREQRIAGRQGGEQRRLDQWLREQQRLALRDPLHLLIEGDDPDRPARDAHYLTYLSRDSEAQLTELATRRAELTDLRAETEKKKVELAEIADEESKSRQILEAEQARRKRTLDQLGKQITSQRQSIARLERDDQRLGALIDRISKVLAEQARREAERERQRAEREAAAKAAARRRSPVPPATPAEEPQERSASAPNTHSSSVNFAQLKGRLSLPVQGSITGRFGGSRRGDDGAAGPAWKGVFIRAPAGADVRAVGSGQVVFADWLRGFGNLLVIDHGDGYLSVYGNNEALLRNAGDRVAVGDVVASVGNTGGNETPGLYFELRFQGRPFDPLTWVAAR